MATFEQRQQTQKAQMIVDKYKEFNKATVERVKTYDPVLRCWYFKKVKIDENAKNMTSYLKGVERENKAKEKRIKESRTGRIKVESKAEKSNPKPRKQYERKQIPASDVLGIIEMYKQGVTVKAISREFKRGGRTINRILLENNVKINRQNAKAVKAQKLTDEILKLIQDGYKNKEISEKLQIEECKVSWTKWRLRQEGHLIPRQQQKKAA
ncbi:hypothetical protein [Elizabethkingia anophelis]|uniref:hypothetical protein n=1 Tax=Elizabethkingia anophelis TaxID=1117645 RepID=UPI003891391C